VQLLGSDVPRGDEAGGSTKLVQCSGVTVQAGAQQIPEPDRPGMRHGQGRAKVQDSKAAVVEETEVPRMGVSVQSTDSPRA